MASVQHDLAHHRRRSIRLEGYDYSSAGAYFVTICTFERECIFGDVCDGRMSLNALGLIAQRQWDALPRHYPNATLDAFLIMPNHVHGVILLTEPSLAGERSVGAGLTPYRIRTPAVGDDDVTHLGVQSACETRPYGTWRVRHGLPEIVRGFKTFSARQINFLRKSRGERVWQRNYYERIVRDEDELNRVREYIFDNPSKWVEDPENPADVVPDEVRLRA